MKWLACVAICIVVRAVLLKGITIVANAANGPATADATSLINAPKRNGSVSTPFDTREMLSIRIFTKWLLENYDVTPKRKRAAVQRKRVG